MLEFSHLQARDLWVSLDFEARGSKNTVASRIDNYQHVGMTFYPVSESYHALVGRIVGMHTLILRADKKKRIILDISTLALYPNSHNVVSRVEAHFFLLASLVA